MAAAIAWALRIGYGSPTMRSDATFILGRTEWLALPDLGLPAIRAKVDTGARTSALHAFRIERFGPASAPMVRFGVHPVPGRSDIEVYCSAPVVGLREVTSSNGEKETRVVIATRVRIGAREWPIEATLTNREGMAYRMLLGRQALPEDVFVDPDAAYRQPKLGYRHYRHLPRHDTVRRALRIALLTRKAESRSNRLIAAAARERGHVLEAISPSRVVPAFDGAEAGLELDGARLGHYDAVIARPLARRMAHDAAVVRQLELMGSAALAGGDALERAANWLAVRQALARAGVASAAHTPPAAALIPHARFLVVDGGSAAAMQRHKGSYRAVVGQRARIERETAERAAAALKLGICAIDVTRGANGPEVLRVEPLPSLAAFERVTGSSGADAIVAALEARTRSWVRREQLPAAEPVPDSAEQSEA